MNSEMETIENGYKEKVLHYYFYNRKKVHLWTIGVVALSAVTIGYLSSGPSDRDYIRAKEAFQSWKDSPTEEKLAFEMFKAIKQIPGMERGLESEIAQTYIAQGLSDTSTKLAQSSLARLNEVSPLHKQFGEATLLIEKQDYQNALEMSVALRELMEQTLDSQLWKGSRMGGGSALYVCNLLRIAFLQKQMRNGPGELAAWEEIKGLIEGNESSAAAHLLQANFGSQQYSLKDYISHRERAIVL
jgi:hypothetical protein